MDSNHNFNRKAEIRLVNSDNMEISLVVIEKENVIMYTINPLFYVLYTSASNLQIFNTRTT